MTTYKSPNMTTHKSWQLNQKMMKFVKGSMIPGKEGMPQYEPRKGRQLCRKVMKPTEGLMNSNKRGMPQVCKSLGSKTRSKGEWSLLKV